MFSLLRAYLAAHSRPHWLGLEYNGELLEVVSAVRKYPAKFASLF